jgi:hypothetical protein
MFARHVARARCVSAPGPPQQDQPACKPGSVWPAAHATNVTAIRLGRRLPGASSNLPERLVRTDPRTWPRTAPIRSCSRWGLPCRFRCRKRGALLPHRFTLAAGQTLRARGGLLFCGTVPGVTPAGRYPAPFVRGARTFLPAALSGPPFQDFGGAAVQPTDIHGMGTMRRDVKPCVVSPVLSRQVQALGGSGGIGGNDASVSAPSWAARPIRETSISERSVNSVDESSLPSHRAGRK